MTQETALPSPSLPSYPENIKLIKEMAPPLFSFFFSSFSFSSPEIDTEEA